MDESLNPWQTLSQKEIYDNKWINLTQYDVINPGGGTGIYGKVHFKNLAIGVLVLDADMNIYLVGQYRYTLNAYSWEIPEGGGPLDQPPLDSAKRELLEETGLQAKEWSLLSTLHLSNSVTDEFGYIYMARQLEQLAPMPEETEQLQVKKVPLAQAYEMVEDGRITDSMSVIAIQKLKILQLEGRLAS